MFGLKHLMTSWDAFHLFIKIEIGVVGFALFCYFLLLFSLLYFVRKEGGKKKSTYSSSMRVPSLSPLCLPASPVASEQRSGGGENGPPWQSAGVSQLLGNWKVNRGAGAKPSSHTAAVGAAGRKEPCARCSGTGQECSRRGGVQPDPPVPRQPRSCLRWAAERVAGTSHVSDCLVPSATAWHAREAVPQGQRQAWFFLSNLDLRGEKPWRCLCSCSCEA